MRQAQPGLEAIIAELRQEIRELKEQVARLSKNSTNSSKPPSSDITKPSSSSSASGEKRKIGGQPGHTKHERRPFPQERVEQTVDYAMTACPKCQGKLIPLPGASNVIQQAELVEKLIYIVEHRGLGYCPARQITLSVPRVSHPSKLPGNSRSIPSPQSAVNGYDNL